MRQDVEIVGKYRNRKEEKMRYREKKWLQNMIEKGTSLREIARNEGVSHHTISQWAKKFGLPTDIYRKTAKHCNLSPELIEFLDGLLLGRGTIVCRHPNTAYLSLAFNRKEYLEWISQELQKLGIEQKGQIKKMVGKRKQYSSWRYESWSYYELVEIRKRWYQKRKKAIPQDIRITPQVGLLWYLGSGYLEIQTKKRKTPFLRIRFSLGRYSEDEVRNLVKKIEEATSCKVKIYHCKPLKITITPPEKFLSFIGPCPEELKPLFGKKWKIY